MDYPQTFPDSYALVNGESVPKRSTFQYAAFVLLVFNVMFSLACIFIPFIIEHIGHDAYYEFYTTIGVHLFTLFNLILPAAAFILLIRCAANKPTKIGIITIILYYVLYGPIFVVSDIIIGGKIGIYCALGLRMLIFIYGISLILNNNTFTKSEFSWIIVLPVLYFYHFGVNIVANYIGQPGYEHIRQAFTIMDYFDFIYKIFFIIVLWRFFMSPAFSGKAKDYNEKKNYSFLNRYAVAMLAVAVIVSLSICLIA